jgi:hypothetical protein
MLIIFTSVFFLGMHTGWHTILNALLDLHICVEVTCVGDH